MHLPSLLLLPFLLALLLTITPITTAWSIKGASNANCHSLDEVASGSGKSECKQLNGKMKSIQTGEKDYTITAYAKYDSSQKNPCQGDGTALQTGKCYTGEFMAVEVQLLPVKSKKMEGTAKAARMIRW